MRNQSSELNSDRRQSCLPGVFPSLTVFFLRLHDLRSMSGLVLDPNNAVVAVLPAIHLMALNVSLLGSAL